MSFIEKIFSPTSFLGKSMRFPLKLLSPNMQIPILSGKLFGKKWIVGSGIHGYWLGIYEFDKQKIFSKVVSKDSIVYDIGANVGFYSLLASLLVGQKGRIVAFEPVPKNLDYLYKHISINKIKNIDVFEFAVSDKNGIATFSLGSNSSMGHIDSSGELQIKTVSLDKFVLSTKTSAPDIIKMDIEGAEILALHGAEKTIIKHHPIIFLATHGQITHELCCDLLKSWGYSLTPIDNTNLNMARELLATWGEPRNRE